MHTNPNLLIHFAVSGVVIQLFFIICVYGNRFGFMDENDTIIAIKY